MGVLAAVLTESGVYATAYKIMHRRGLISSLALPETETGPLAFHTNSIPSYHEVLPLA